MVKICVKAVVCSLVLLIGGFARGKQESPAYQLPHCVVSVTAYDEAGSVLRRGIGLVISDLGDVIAPGDVVDGASRVEVAARGKSYPLSRLIAKHAESGLVLFYAPLPNGAARPARTARLVPNVGEQVEVVVMNERSRPSIIMGIIGTVKTKSRVGEYETLSVDGNLPRRSLGNPVFNVDGDLVGVVSHQPDDASSFTVHAGNEISKMLEESLGVRGSITGDNVTGAAGSTGPLSIKELPYVGGVHQGRAISRAEPAYPDEGKQYHITGSVTVEITIDETGHVIAARAIGGRFQKPVSVSENQARQIIPAFQKTCVDAASKWKFEPARVSGVPVKVIGTVTFNFAM